MVTSSGRTRERQRYLRNNRYDERDRRYPPESLSGEIALRLFGGDGATRMRCGGRRIVVQTRHCKRRSEAVSSLRIAHLPGGGARSEVHRNDIRKINKVTEHVWDFGSTEDMLVHRRACSLFMDFDRMCAPNYAHISARPRPEPTQILPTTTHPSALYPCTNPNHHELSPMHEHQFLDDITIEDNTSVCRLKH